MEVVQTITLSDKDRITVSNFLKLTDDISNIARCSMDDVFLYLADKAEITENGYTISALHQISDIA